MTVNRLQIYNIQTNYEYSLKVISSAKEKNKIIKPILSKVRPSSIFRQGLPLKHNKGEISSV
jgi:hypothetical protein